MKEITGRHVLIFTVGAFAVIIGVNLLLAYKAVSTFPGLEVDNSYVASQEFDARREAQNALGWTVDHRYEDGLVKLAITDQAGVAVELAKIDVLIGRPTESRDDMWPEFTLVAGVYEARADLTKGRWIVKLTATAQDGTLFEQRYDFQIKG
ncbi:MAG: FixH family protein [Paracoccaceae bacterium]